MKIDPRLQTNKITAELIDYIVGKIVREIRPEKIILYGSEIDHILTRRAGIRLAS